MSSNTTDLITKTKQNRMNTIEKACKEKLKIKEYNDFIDEIRNNYPYGYLDYIRRVARECHKQKIFSGYFDIFSITRIAPESWLHWFMSGISPEKAVVLDLKESGINVHSKGNKGIGH